MTSFIAFDSMFQGDAFQEYVEADRPVIGQYEVMLEQKDKSVQVLATSDEIIVTDEDES